MKLNKKIVLSAIIVLIIAIIILIIIFNNKDNNNDASKFSNEYTNVPINNKFIYVDAKEAVDILQNKTGILFMGFSDCLWCQDYAKYLNEVIMDTTISEIYYLDIYNDRKKDSKEYKEIIKILNNNLSYDDMGNHQILVPSTTFVLNGMVINYDDETSYVSSDMNSKKDYWTDDKVRQFKDKIGSYTNDLINNGVCNDNNAC